MIRMAEENRKVTFFLSGRLDAESAPELDKQIRRVDIAVTEIVFDFAELEYVSSMGLRNVLSAYKLMKARGGEFRVIHIPPAVRNVFEMTGFMKTFERDEKLVVVQTARELNGVTFTLTGILDETTSPLLEREISSLKGTRSALNVELDCTSLKEMSAEGAKALLHLQKDLGTHLRLKGANPEVARAVAAAGGAALAGKESAAAGGAGPGGKENAATRGGDAGGVHLMGGIATYTCFREWELLQLPLFSETWYRDNPAVKSIHLDFTAIPKLSGDAFAQITALRDMAEKHGVKVNAAI